MVAAAAPAMASAAPVRPPPASTSRPRALDAGGESLPLDILLVEDEPDILDLVGEALARHGHRVTAVADGADAMAWLDRRFFDVAVCDVRLPNVDGMRIFHRIRAESPRCQVILMSAYGSVAEAVAAMQEDATHYLAKPFNMDVLLELVERIQQQRQLEERLSAGRSSREEEDASPLIGTSPSLCHLPEELRGEDLPERASDRLLPLAEAVADFEREYLLRALRRCKWHKAQTAALMGVSRKTLWHKLKLYDIDGP